MGLPRSLSDGNRNLRSDRRRNLRSALRPALEDERKKKLGRFGRDDRRGWVVRGTQASRRFFASRVRPEGLTYNSCDAPPALGERGPATLRGSG